ncbi:unnamed protein product [Lymnaea stagnalis]|uniref:Uncharacterized protein n=1 Tax=Lymnaea stagnalis TaxID=6523 RepID=A0AAV2H4S2_LYMST
MGSYLLCAVVLLVVMHVTIAVSPPTRDGFSMQYYIGSIGPYDIRIDDADLMVAFEDMCDARTLVHNRTFHHVTGTVLSFKTKRIIEDPTVYYNIFSCQIKETYTLSCRRMNQTRCYPAQQYFEFRSIHRTPADCQCVGICFNANLVNLPENDYFIKADLNTSQCEVRLPPVTTAPPRDVDFDAFPNRDDFGRDDHRVDTRMVIVIGAVLGAGVLCLLVVVTVLIVALRRVVHRQDGKTLEVPYAMFPEMEKKPISNTEYPPRYTTLVETSPTLNVEEAKTDMGQSAPPTYI